MVSFAGFTLGPLVVIAGVVILVILAFSLFRFFIHLALRLIGIVLTIAILLGVVLFFMNAIHIHW